MFIKKKEKNPINYGKNGWFISEVIIKNSTFYSKDGFEFRSSRVLKLNLTQLLSLKSTHFKILSIENPNEDVISITKNAQSIEYSIMDNTINLSYTTNK